MINYQLSNLTGETKAENLSGAYFKGVQFYDMAKINSINNSGIADLVELVKAWSDLGIEVRFVNARKNIIEQINQLDLEKVISFETA